ncbi:membrane protein [Patiriisocius marinistellae]|uniref:Membrane protein n=1 Tax=Patiriisocius marinistellae TaxID=2494560 RepID=A0A5J4G0K3_9FLAO|nr:membrane protein [Patiriisocius marinistellae]
MLASISALAQTEVASKIEAVKIFTNNAQVTRDASFITTLGKQEVVLTGISTTINPSSLQVLFDNTNTLLLSAKYENNYLNSKINNPEIEGLKTELETINDDLEWLSHQRTSLQGMLQILEKNQDLGSGTSSFTPQQVLELSNVYRTKFLQIKEEMRALDKKEKPLREKASKLKGQLAELNAKFNVPSGNIVLQIESKKAERINLDCKYIVNNVGWSPIYDLRSGGIIENVNLTYKASIYQNTGLDWDNVDLTISTGNPSQNNNRPILSPLYASIYEQQMRREYDAVMEEVEVSSMNMAYKQSADGVNPTSVSENQLTIDFKILTKQSIASDGKENLVGLQTFELDTEYVYHTVPKLDRSAYLLAKITDWSQYNLVAGKANIFFEGAFVGTSNINPKVTAKELLISMGVDNSIVVERTPIKEYTSSKFIGSNKKETIGYEITVKNKKATPIKIEILDQIPVSQNKKIEVEIEDNGGAVYTEDIGKLLWTINLQARETVVKKFMYSVKYPKDSGVIGVK